MLKKIKILMCIAASLLVVAVSFSSMSTHKQLLSCLCTDNVQFNNSLPQSHPINRCANQQAQQSTISWSSWLFGTGNSRQFHYLDLLELLSRSSDITEHAPHQS